jgi:Hemerythrin HHE cation binding domain
MVFAVRAGSAEQAVNPSAERTLTINAAFLQEIKDDNRELRHLLEGCAALLARPDPVGVDLKRLAKVLGSLRDQLAMHFALEEAYGYFDDAIDVAPRLSRLATLLKAQHPTLFLELCGIVEQSEQLMYHETASSAAEGLAREFAEFQARFLEHEAEENALIMQEVNEEIGGGD